LRQEKDKNEQMKKEKQLRQLEKDLGEGDEIIKKPESLAPTNRPTIQMYSDEAEVDNYEGNFEIDGTNIN
jgi:hypothetical protein